MSLCPTYCTWSLGFIETEIMERKFAFPHISQTSNPGSFLMANGILLETS